jgi:hypothetical protein
MSVFSRRDGFGNGRRGGRSGNPRRDYPDASSSGASNFHSCRSDWNSGRFGIAEVGTFLNDPQACSRPIPTLFPSYIEPGAVLDPKRILVGRSSNLGRRSPSGLARKEHSSRSTPAV